jgi:putative ABC transport system permease protein
MESIMPRLELDYPDSYPPGFSAVITPLDTAVVGQARQVLWILFGTTGFVLLIACVNTTSLLLSRFAARRREMAVRLAVGGSRMRLIRQSLTETTVLTLFGGAVGLLIASSALRVFLHWAPASVPRLADVHLDSGVFLFALVISVVAGQVVGLVPAIAVSYTDHRESLQQGLHGTSARSHRRLRNSLIICEVASAFVLTLGTCLLLRSMENILNVNPGFRADRLFTTNFGLVGPAYAQVASVPEFNRQVMDRMRVVPGVDAVGIVSTLPLSGAHDRRAIHIQDRPLPNAASAPFLDTYFVSPDYFRAMGIPLERGRSFTEADATSTSAPVAIISQLAARQMWPNEEALGKHIQVGVRNDTAPWATVVGIVGDIRQYGLDSTPTAEVYLTYEQASLNFPTVVIRSNLSPDELERAVEQQVAALDKNVPVFDPATMNEIIALSVGQRRFITALAVSFGLLALVLSSMGIYGVMAFEITQRTNEIGIRMALGAQPGGISRMILGEGLLLTLIGIILGIGGALALMRFLVSLLFDIKPTDLATFITVAILLLSVAILACYIPARRAMHVDPIVALRYE